MPNSSPIQSISVKQRAIGKIPLFSSLSSTDRDRLAELLTLREFQKGTTIISSAEDGRDIMFVADGAVDVKRASDEGKEVILTRLGEGQFVGEIAVLTAAARTADVEAVEDSMLLIMRAADFEQLIQSNSSFSRALLVDLAHRVAAASTRISDLALHDVYCRVHRTLIQLARAENNKSKNKGEFLELRQRPVHKDLAAMVGSSREMVTRALSKLADEGIVVEDGQCTLVRAR